jgi:fatty acid synthase subunit alpha
MLAVTGLALKDLEPHIKKTNVHLPANSQLHVYLHNGPRAFVPTGPARALYGLVTNLRKIRAPSGLDQSKMLFSQRKLVFSVRFLVVNAPFHSEYLARAMDKLCTEDMGGEELWTTKELGILVYNMEDGTNNFRFDCSHITDPYFVGLDMRKLLTSITRSLCDQISTSSIQWTAATNFPETATYAIDFGPGGIGGIGPLTARNLDGRGVRVIVVGDKGRGGAEVYGLQNVRYEEWWRKKWGPQPVRTRYDFFLLYGIVLTTSNSDGTIHIDTPYPRLLGKPPIMVAGMTPSTVRAGFVSAIISTGFHVELAIRAKVAEIQSQIPAGVSITLNSLYINPRQFMSQLPLWQEMRKEGLPIESFCVAAGIPRTEKAVEIIDGLRQAGIKHVAFKPGSVEGIRQVVSIAVTSPNFPIILQWTGGRAGGHHSYEDFHHPILATYNSVRQHSNISLIAGSEFGAAEDIWPYLTGDWAVQGYGVQPMPIDGFLFASRVMVANEALTSSSILFTEHGRRTTIPTTVPPVLVVSRSHDYLGLRSWTAHVNIRKQSTHRNDLRALCDSLWAPERNSRRSVLALSGGRRRHNRLRRYCRVYWCFLSVCFYN